MTGVNLDCPNKCNLSPRSIHPARKRGNKKGERGHGDAHTSSWLRSLSMTACSGQALRQAQGRLARIENECLARSVNLREKKLPGAVVMLSEQLLPLRVCILTEKEGHLPAAGAKHQVQSLEAHQIALPSL
jgi:hypothetical protein